MTEEGFEVVDRVPQGSCLAPVDLTIHQLKEKYRGVKIQDVTMEYQRLAREMLRVQLQLREMNVLENYERMGDSQQKLQDMCDMDSCFLKTNAGYNNIVALHPGDLFENKRDKDEKKYSYMFFKDLAEGLTFTEGLPEEVQNEILLVPLFLSI